MSVAHKIFLLAFVLYTASGYLEEKDFGEPGLSLAILYKDICMDVTGASQEVIEQYRNGSFVPNEKAQRYVLCMWRVPGFMDKNLTVNETLVDSRLPQKEKDADFLGQVRKCHAEIDNSGDEENYEKIFKFEQCLYNLDSANYIQITILRNT